MMISLNHSPLVAVNKRTGGRKETTTMAVVDVVVDNGGTSLILKTMVAVVIMALLPLWLTNIWPTFWVADTDRQTFG